MDFSLTPAQLDIRKAAREFAEREFPHIAKDCDAEETFPLDLLRQASQLGFVGIFIDGKYGGRGFGFLENAIVMEEFWRVDPGLGSQVMCACFGSEMILLKGSEEQKMKYLPPVCKGEAISAVAVTEPDAGSDVLSVSTRAERKGRGYFINGSKMFISNGDIANFLVALCLSNPDATSPYERHSVIVIETDRPGLGRNKLKGKMGIRAHDTAEISLNNVWVPEENLIGEEGKGFNCFMDFFNRSRAYVAAQGVGIAQGALEMALRYVNKRKQFWESYLSFEIVQSKLAEMATWTEAARNLVYKAAWMLDRGQVEPAFISMAKWYAGEVGVKVVNESLQIHGECGYLSEYDISRFYRDAKIVEIYEGTKEIEKLVIARQLLKGKRLDI
ncbi:MAG: acyl-CoA dehydrogenase family protein [Thermodesulfobacteriota bacterium]|jgi:alkylation response protein AidB-like acyl-CoA dehydrogenase